MNGVLSYEIPETADRADGANSGKNFVLGPENALLAEPLQRLLDPDRFGREPNGPSIFNPMVLVGASGSGKSTLLQATADRWAAHLGEAAVQSFNMVDFGREVQAMQRDGELESWRRELHRAQLLVIDDLQRARPRQSIHNALRSAIDAILQQGGLILAASQIMPASLLQLSAGLRDRLAAGLIVQVQWPGKLARRELIRDEADRLSLSLDDQRLEELAERCDGSAARVIGALAELELRGAPRPATSETLTPQKIATVVSRYLDVPKRDLLGKSRQKSLVYARSLTAHLCRRITKCSFAEIGSALGGRDHTTIIHADRSIADQASRDPATQQAIEELQRILTAS